MKLVSIPTRSKMLLVYSEVASCSSNATDCLVQLIVGNVPPHRPFDADDDVLNRYLF